MPFPRHRLFPLLLLAGHGAALFAQISTDLRGRILDPSNAAVSSAQVTATEITTAIPRTTTSTPDGSYDLPALAPGRYRIDVSAPGFAHLTREGITLVTGTTTGLDLSLSLPSAQQSVTITADAPLLQAADQPTSRPTSPAPPVVALPLNSRNFIQLAALAPGVALPPGTLLPRINGGRPRTNEYLYDGISALQPEPGQVAFFPIVDDIRRVHHRGQQRPRRVRPLQRRRRQRRHPRRHQPAPRQPLRVLPQRRPQRAQLLLAAPHPQARVPPQPLRRHPRRPHPARPPLLLRRLPGHQAAHRPAHRHLHRPHARRAPGHLHRRRKIYNPATTRRRRRQIRPPRVPQRHHQPARSIPPPSLSSPASRSPPTPPPPPTTTPAPPTTPTTRTSSTSASIGAAFSPRTTAPSPATPTSPKSSSRSPHSPTAAAPSPAPSSAPATSPAFQRPRPAGRLQRDPHLHRPPAQRPPPRLHPPRQHHRRAE